MTRPAALLVPLVALALIAWTRARGRMLAAALTPDDWRLAAVVFGVLSTLGLVWLVRWVLKTVLERAMLNAHLKALDHPELQKRLGKVLREEVLSAEIAALNAAVAGAGECVKQWGDIGKDVAEIGATAEEAHATASANREWMEDLSHALDVAMQLERRSGGDRRQEPGFAVPPLPAPAERRRASDRRRRRDD